MSAAGGGERPAREPPAVSVAAIAWFTVTALFLLLRLGPVWRAPVGGAELLHLSGAWQASIGVEDARFVPSLFQAVSALTLVWTDSEIPARALAYAATATIPLALYLLRRPLGRAGALLALLFLAVNGAAIGLGSTAAAVAWDQPIAVWLAVLLLAVRPPPWAWLPAAFLAATAGPLVLPLVLAAAALALSTGTGRAWVPLAWGGGGAALAILLTSLSYGFGAGIGFRIAPVDLFAASFDEAWSTANGAALVALYGLPIVVAGVAAAALAAYRLRRREEPFEGPLPLLIAWFGVALLWMLVALGSHASAALVAVSLPASLLLGPAVAAASGPLVRARWREASLLLPAAAGLSAVSAFVLADWGRTGGVGGLRDQLLVALPLILAVAALALLAARRETAPVLLAPALALGGLIALSGASGVVLSGAGEPLPSPQSPGIARDLRDLAIDARADGGLVVVHDGYRDAVTWAFRDSGTIVFATRVPPDAVFLVWPPEAPAPNGLVPVEGRWFLERSLRAPDGFLDYIRWLGDRQSLLTERLEVAVYTRPE